MCGGVHLGRGWASPPELPWALGQHSVQKSLSAEGSDGAAVQLGRIPRQGRMLRSHVAADVQGPSHQRKMWSQTRLLEPRAVPPASDFRSSHQQPAQGQKLSSQSSEPALGHGCPKSIRTPLAHRLLPKRERKNSETLSISEDLNQSKETI